MVGSYETLNLNRAYSTGVSANFLSCFRLIHLMVRCLHDDSEGGDNSYGVYHLRVWIDWERPSYPLQIFPRIPTSCSVGLWTFLFRLVLSMLNVIGAHGSWCTGGTRLSLAGIVFCRALASVLVFDI